MFVPSVRAFVHGVSCCLILALGTAPTVAAGPARADVAYGPDPRQRLDLYLPNDGSGPYPVLIWFGNLWAPGKTTPPNGRFLPAGCATVGVATRVMQDAVQDKIQPPISVCLLDARRAVQFVRLHAAEWNLDPARIALGGGSQGALPALYVGCAGERANPRSTDPVERVSTRVACVAAYRSQPSIDPRRMREWVPGVEWGAPALGCGFAESLKRRDELEPVIAAWSPDALINNDAPPIYFENDWGLTRPDSVGETDYLVHSPRWGLGFQRLARERGAVCHVKFPGHPTEKYADIWDFVVQEIGAGSNDSRNEEHKKASPAPGAVLPKESSREPVRFPLAVWLQSPANAERYRAIGINNYVALWRGPTKEQLDLLDRAGMRLFCAQTEQSLRFLDRPTIVGWMHGDEPDNAQSLGTGKGYGPPIAPAAIVADYRKIRQADPTRPVMLNLGQGVAWDGWYGRGVRTNHPEDYAEYVKGCDIASFDIYPACHENAAIAGKLWYVPRGVDRLRRWAGAGKTVWCCIETTGIDNIKRKAAPRQVRSEVWMALIHGAGGIIYFAHQFKPRFIEAGLLADAAMAREVGAINAQIQVLAPVLKSPDEAGASVSSSTDRIPIDFVVKRHAGRTYLFAVAMREGETTATFKLPKSAPARVEVLGEDRVIESRGGVWSDRFRDYGVHLYRIEPGR